MSLQKFDADRFCDGGRHRSTTKNIHGDIISKCSEVHIGCCSICERKKSMTVSDNTIQAEGLTSFFKNLGRDADKAGEKIATIVLKNPERALHNTANITTAAARINPKNILSTLPKVINFYHTGKNLYLGKLV